MKMKGTARLTLALIAVWAAFTVTLLLWWLFFGLDQLSTIATFTSEAAQKFERHRSMLMWEGGTLILSVVAGAGGLLYLLRREFALLERIKIFFATFAHELKTPLASLRLQAESLLDQSSDKTLNDSLARIVGETTRLNLQLENSLLMAGLDHAELLFETVRLSDAIAELKPEWPDLEVAMQRDCMISADRRALQAVLRNLAHNAIVHGRASLLRIDANAIASNQVSVRFEDDGEGFQGELRLGQPFQRTYTGSGNGLGLYLIDSLVRRMHGELKLIRTAPGFCVSVALTGEVL